MGSGAGRGPKGQITWHKWLERKMARQKWGDINGQAKSWLTEHMRVGCVDFLIKMKFRETCLLGWAYWQFFSWKAPIIFWIFFSHNLQNLITKSIWNKSIKSVLSHLCTWPPLISPSLLGNQSPIILSPASSTNYAPYYVTVKSTQANFNQLKSTQFLLLQLLGNQIILFLCLCMGSIDTLSIWNKSIK